MPLLSGGPQELRANYEKIEKLAQKHSLDISDALQLENLDYNEFAATVDDITLAVASHHGRLAKYREAA